MEDEHKEFIRQLWAEYSPRIDAARNEEAEKAATIFVDLHEERILEFPAVVLTLERYLLIQQAGILDGSSGEGVNNPLVFLWIVSPDFVPDPKKGKKFFRKHRKLNILAYSCAIEDYVSRMFRQQAKPSHAQGKSSGKSREWISTIIDLIASEYGWKESDIFRIPIPRILRYVNKIRIRHGGKTIDFESEGDRLKAEFMDKVNTGSDHG